MFHVNEKQESIDFIINCEKFINSFAEMFRF